MSKRNAKSSDDATGDDDLTLERLRRHLAFLGLTRTLDQLADLLAWAVRERPGPTALDKRSEAAAGEHREKNVVRSAAKSVA